MLIPVVLDQNVRAIFHGGKWPKGLEETQISSIAANVYQINRKCNFRDVGYADIVQ